MQALIADEAEAAIKAWIAQYHTPGSAAEAQFGQTLAGECGADTLMLEARPDGEGAEAKPGALSVIDCHW